MEQIQIKNYSRVELENMSSLSIYMLMEERSLDVFGLWDAEKSELIKAYCEQIA